MAKRMLCSWIAVVMLVSALAGCGDGGGRTDEGAHGTGETVQVGNVAIVMDSASLLSHRVRVEFTIENRGSEALVVDPETSFAVMGDSGGTEVLLGIDPTCTNELNGTVPAGGSLSGQLCWRSDPSRTWPEVVTITYAAAETDSGPAIWTVRGD
jgi:hypothetical protein